MYVHETQSGTRKRSLTAYCPTTLQMYKVRPGTAQGIPKRMTVVFAPGANDPLPSE